MAIRPNLTVAAVVATTLMALAMGTTLMALAMILIASSSQVHDRNTSLLVFSLHSPFIFLTIDYGPLTIRLASSLVFRSGLRETDH